MTVSVVIPTYKRLSGLLRALRSLQEQSLPGFEILAVDNEASREVERSVAAFNESARLPALYLGEPDLGLQNARHRGARAASGGILVFTDDDASFDPGWLAAYSDAFDRNPDMVAAGGPVRPQWEMPPPQWLLDFIGTEKIFPILSLMEPNEAFRLEPDGFFFGVNMAIRRETLFAMGGFNPESVGGTWIGDGESGLNRRLWERGLLIGYVPEASVFHHIPPSRMTMRYFRRRMANEGACDAYARLRGTHPKRVRLIRSMLSTIRTNGTAWIRAALLRDSYDASSIACQLQAARAWSQLKYTGRLLFDHRLRELVARLDWL